MMNTTTLLHINQFFTFFSKYTLLRTYYSFKYFSAISPISHYPTHFPLSHSFPDKYKTRVLHTFVSIEENLLTYQHNYTVILCIYSALFHNFTIHFCNCPVYIHPSYYAFSISTLFYSVYLRE
jgi:hypothetical protein